RLRTARGAAIDRNDARTLFGPQRIGDETLATVDVPGVDLLVLADARGIQQHAVDRDRTLVVQLGVGHGGAMDLGLEHVQVHDVLFQQELRKAALYGPRVAASQHDVRHGACFEYQSSSRLSIRRVLPSRAATSATSRSPAWPLG